MKKAGIILVTAVSVALLAACGGKGLLSGDFSPVVSCIYAARDGSISSAIVETYENDYYEEAELREVAEKAVIAYNTENGAERRAENEDGKPKLPVALADCSLEKGKAKLVFDYASGEDLAAFTKQTNDEKNQVDSLVISDFSEAVSGGTVSDGTLVSAKDGSAVSNEKAAKNQKLKAVIVSGQGIIQTEGKILYMTEGCKLADEYTAATSDGESVIVFQ